tara:strand:+ start:466 stop:681 length:216 start_codon:yes stop_codon:yes gene_type:complete
MKVNINGIWYNSEDMPIQIQLSKSDKKNIKNMHDDKFNYISFPSKMKWEDVEIQLKGNTPIDGGTSFETLI